MTPSLLRDAVDAVRHELVQALAEGSVSAVIEPIAAGLRARAVSDACTRLELAAVLIDRTGRVLHLNPDARTWVQDGRIRLADEHLVRADPASNRGISDAISAAIGLRADDTHPDIQQPDLGFVGLPFRDTSGYQLLRGVVILGASRHCRRIAALHFALGA